MTAPVAHPLRVAHEADWQRLESILTIAERRGARRLSDDDLLALPILYRTALSALSVARETSLDAELIAYLEVLCARAYLFVYGVRSSPVKRIASFFRRDWPAAVRSLWRELLAATLFLLLGIAAGALLVMADSEWYAMLVPTEMSSGRDFSATPASLAETLDASGESEGLAVFSTFLFTHNSQMEITCFALGFAFGIPTLLLLVYNGSMLGAMAVLFASKGLGLQFMGWILIHGTTELLAIAVAGAAGLRIGLAVLFPGEQDRVTSVKAAGRTASRAMIGVVLMLFLAGLLEGVARQTIGHVGWRYGIGLGVLLLWTVYFGWAGREAEGREREGRDQHAR